MFDGVRAVALDVDGVLTDGTFTWSASGEESKNFSFADATGIRLALAGGIVVALVSAESSVDGKTLVQRYADKVGIRDVFAGSRDKQAAVSEFAARHGLDLKAICFVGDDVADLPAMAVSGVSAAPIDAHPSVLAQVDYVTTRPGGRGAVREVTDLILSARAGSSLSADLGSSGSPRSEH